MERAGADGRTSWGDGGGIDHRNLNLLEETHSRNCYFTLIFSQIPSLEVSNPTFGSNSKWVFVFIEGSTLNRFKNPARPIMDCTFANRSPERQIENIYY
ncbi:hypothetical protein EVAR_75312_1 [Eumeta japonica]|uniref:Uncharacterized protein n=1 Tax=Eumeta variegata TaxID=151549 RepID=A0A4C1XYL4_EUMVA|nr:hypothetical protein EVAR_75312_1 [Eumeta japonica]